MNFEIRDLAVRSKPPKQTLEDYIAEMKLIDPVFMAASVCEHNTEERALLIIKALYNQRNDYKDMITTHFKTCTSRVIFKRETPQ